MFAILLMLLLWASAFPAIRLAVRDYPPGDLALLRFLAASLTLAIPSLWLRHAPPRRAELPLIGAAGFCGFTVYNVALNAGEISLEAGAASFIVNTAPIFTVLLATLFLGERTSRWGWLGISISLCGAILLSLNKGGALRFGEGTSLVFLSAISASVYVVLQKKVLQNRVGEYSHLPEYSRALRTTTHIIWAGTIFLLLAPTLSHIGNSGSISLLPAVFSLPRVLAAAPLSSTLLVIYLGVFPAALAYAMWAWLLARIPVSTAVNFLYGIPVFATLIAWLWLGETLTWRALLGGVLVLCGVIVVNTRGRAKS